jgi:hypothetical protein
MIATLINKKVRIAIITYNPACMYQGSSFFELVETIFPPEKIIVRL